MDRFLSSNYGEKGLGTNFSAQYVQTLRRENNAENPNNQTSDSIYDTTIIDDPQVANEATMM